MSIAGWTMLTAVATAALVLGAVFAAIIGYRQLGAQAETWREEQRAYVIVEFADSLADRHLIDFVVRNLGKTPAFDVSMSWSPGIPDEAKPIAGHEFRRARILGEPLSMIPPGRELRLFFDSHIERGERSDLQNAYDVTVTYRDRWGERHTDTYALDLRPIGGTYIRVSTLNDVANHLDKLHKTLARTVDRGQIQVVTETVADRAERETADYYKRWRKRGVRPRRRAAKSRGR